MANIKKLLMALAFFGRFAPSFTQIGYRVRRLFWKPYAADFRGQHWLVTGASGGLGREMVLAALRGGASVTAVARDAGKLAELARLAKSLGPVDLHTECCDFTLTADTQRLIDRLVASGRSIRVLMNNVGVLNDECLLTTEGREASFVSNLLAHFQLTEALVSAGLLGDGSAVVNISSGGGYTVPLVTAALNLTDAARFNGVLVYGMHKRAQMVLNQYWREPHRDRRIDFYVMHPGWADTAGVQRSLPRFRQLMKSVLRDAQSGADTAIWLAATRPAQSAGELVWFDRKIRPAHVYGYTRQTTVTPTALAAFLQSELARTPFLERHGRLLS